MNQEILKIYFTYQEWFSYHIDRDEKWKYNSNSDYDENMRPIYYIRYYRWMKTFLMIESLSFSYKDIFSFWYKNSIRISSIWYRCNFMKIQLEFQRWAALMITKEQRTCFEYDVKMIGRSRNEEEFSYYSKFQIKMKTSHTACTIYERSDKSSLRR